MARNWILISFIVAGARATVCSAFSYSSFHSRNFKGAAEKFPCHSGSYGRRNISMVFDFFKKRASEGIRQVENIAGKAVEGKLAEALEDTTKYIQERRAADAESFLKFTNSLKKSREKFLEDLNRALGKRDSLDSTLRSIEEVLMTSDIGSQTTQKIIDDLRKVATQSENDLTADDVNCVLRETLIQVLKGSASVINGKNSSAINFAPLESKLPSIIFVMGANGMGKTTTIGKIAYRLREQNELKVLLCAADTFRAAAVDQLEEWSVRAGVDIVKPIDAEETPESVAERACKKAVEEAFDVAIIDTSGRLSNNRKLNQELQKIKSVIASQVYGAPHETLLVVDASVGRNAFEQARVWKSAVGVTGVAVTKLDGTARAGYVVSIVQELGIPIKLIGVGEGLNDLRDFNAELFVDALLGYSPERAAMLKQRYELNPVLQARAVLPDERDEPTVRFGSSSGEIAEKLSRKARYRMEGKLKKKSKKSNKPSKKK